MVRRTGNTVFGAQNGDVNSYDEVDKAFPTDSGRAWEQGYSFVTCMGSKNSKYVCKHNYIPLPIRQPARQVKKASGRDSAHDLSVKLSPCVCNHPD